MRRADGLLRSLERLREAFGTAAAARRLGLVRQLDKRPLATAREVHRLHEALCFARAYPDDRKVLAVVEHALERFERRADLRRHREALADTGIAGTTIRYRFYWAMAGWLVERWPERLTVEWPDFDDKDALESFLHLLVPYTESPALDELELPLARWVRRLAGPGESDAAFLVRRFRELRADDFVREALYEHLDIPLRLAPGPGTPSRTRARHASAPVVFQVGPLRRDRPSLRAEARRPPLAVRAVSRREARALIDLAREAMATRSRDLDAFANADENDVRLVDCGGGLQFACFGAVPERRLMFEAVYGFLTLKNGVPIGYVLSSALLRSAEIAYNVFETFRGAEAALVLGRVLSMVRHLFGAETFSIDPFQLGQGNREGLESGAWWFYAKLGFRPEDPAVRRLAEAEFRRAASNPRHRSGIRTLERLSAASVFLYLDGPREDVLGKVSLGSLALRVARRVAERFGSDRERATRECSREAARMLGPGSLGGFSRSERMWWERWAPVVTSLPGVSRWGPADRRALVRVVRAKGGRRESDFVRLFDAHPRLGRAMLRLAQE